MIDILQLTSIIVIHDDDDQMNNLIEIHSFLRRI